MLRRLDVNGPWRSLDQGFWPQDLPLGRRTIVYGHNGSGKSTLSELLLSFAEGEGATRVEWEDALGVSATIDEGGEAPSPSMAVFTRRWVEHNLSAFLDGDSAAAIVTLGKEAIDAQAEEAQLVAEIGELRKAESVASEKEEADAKKSETLVREVQDEIVSKLKPIDYTRFTKNRYSVTKVQDDLRSYRGQFPDGKACAEALRWLGEEAPSTVPVINEPPSGISGRLGDVAEVLAEMPTRSAIQALEGDPSAQSWVERGLSLHEKRDHCLYCDGEIETARRERLARHFDESWLRIRGQAMELLAAATTEKATLADWLDGLPDAASLAIELRGAYEHAIRTATTEVDERVVVLENIEIALAAKADNPGAAQEMPDWSLLNSVPSTAVLAQAVEEHNDQVRRHSENADERKQTVLDYLFGSNSEEFRRLEAQAGEATAKKMGAAKAVELAEKRLEKVRKSQFTTAEMAAALTRDLERVYGKDHLNVAVTSDGKSYACRRGAAPGTNLSDGERTTLSLLYFLRKLEDEQASGSAPSERIVVIDDPSSSLDREALFATHQWLFDTLQGFGQYIILTHDFSLLGLFIKSHRNAWGKSQSKIKDADPDEIRFPKVAFLEMYAATVEGERRSMVGKLPRVLMQNTSEYAYLFSMVMAGIHDSEDHDRLFLLPNAARRVLEVFASYKAPHRTDFIQQLEVIVKSQEGEPYRDVYDFCNRYSHGEGSESVDVLDARAVHGQIRRCMELLQSVDPEHFERMCKATDSASIMEK